MDYSMLNHRILWSELALTGNGDYSIKKIPCGEPFPVGEIKVNSVGSTESIFVAVRTILKASDNIHITVVLRCNEDVMEDARFRAGGLYRDVNRPRMSYLLVPTWGDREIIRPFSSGHVEYMAPYRGVAKKRNPGLPIEAVVGSYPHVVKSIALQLGDAKKVVPGVVHCDSAVESDGFFEPWGKWSSNEIKREQLASISLGLWHVFLANQQKKIWFGKIVGHSVKASTMQRMMKRSVVISNGIDLDEVHRIVGEIGFSRGRSIGSFYTISEQKGTPETLETIERMVSGALVDSVTVTSAGCFNEEGVFGCNLPVHSTIISGCNRDDYLRVMSKVAVGIFNSKFESSPTAPIEAMAVGCVPLVPNNRWAQETLGSLGWKWVYSDMDEAVSMAMYIFEHHDEEGHNAMRFVREYYDGMVHGSNKAKFICDAIRSQNMAINLKDEKFKEFLDENSTMMKSARYLLEKPSFDWFEFMGKFQMPRRFGGGSWMFSKHDISAFLYRLAGYVDDLTQPYPVYRKA